MKSVSRMISAGLGRMWGSWCQHLVMSLRSGSGQSVSIQGRSPLMATCMGCKMHTAQLVQHCRSLRSSR